MKKSDENKKNIMQNSKDANGTKIYHSTQKNDSDEETKTMQDGPLQSQSDVVTSSHADDEAKNSDQEDYDQTLDDISKMPKEYRIDILREIIIDLIKESDMNEIAKILAQLQKENRLEDYDISVEDLVLYEDTDERVSIYHEVLGDDSIQDNEELADDFGYTCKVYGYIDSFCG